MAINSNPNQPQDRRQGSGFTNLQNIMQANVGNRLGSAVGQGIQKTGEQAKEGLNQAQNEFKTQSEAGRLDTTQNKERVENVLNDAGNATDQDVDQFSKFRAGQYVGPQNLSNINNLQGQAQEAQQLGQAAGSQEGRQGLLQRFAASPGQYNSGQQRLDSLLLGSSGSQPLKEARRSVSGLGQKVSSAGEAAQGVAQQYQNQAQGFGKDVNERLQSGVSSIYNPAQQQAEQANASDIANAAKFQQEQQDAQAGQFSQEALDKLGLTAGQRTYGVNLGQYLGYTPQNEQATALNVMEQPKFQQYSGLQRLMGQQAPEAPQQAYQAGKTTYGTATNPDGTTRTLAEDIAAGKAVMDPLEQNYGNTLASYNNFVNNWHGGAPGRAIAYGDYGTPASSAGFSDPGRHEYWTNDAPVFANYNNALTAINAVRNKYGGNANLIPPKK